MHTLPTRNPLTLITAFLLLLALPYAPNTFAQELTDKTVRSFVEVMESMEPLTEKHKAFLDELEEQESDEEPEFSALMSSGIEDIKGHPVYEDLEDLVQEHGFSSVEAWAQTGDQVMEAWMALEMENQPAGMMEQMQASMEQIENAPHLTPEQKAELKAMMQGSLKGFESLDKVPESSKAVVKPYVERLRLVSKDDDEDEEYDGYDGEQ